MYQPYKRIYNPYCHLEKVRRKRNDPGIETHAQSLGEYLRILNHQYCEYKRKQPNIIASKHLIELRASYGRAESVRGSIQYKNHRNGFFYVLFKLGAYAAYPRILLF